MPTLADIFAKCMQAANTSRSRPILFSSPMVRAILSGAKSQTRRVVKPVGNDDSFVLQDYGDGWWPFRSDDGETAMKGDNEIPHACPYGKPGDRLWVREAWRVSAPNDKLPPREVKPCDSVHYEADIADAWPARSGKMRPGMFMPRWASRFIAEVTEVRVECLQDISRGDAMAEGCPFPNMAQGPDPRQWYAGLWEGINGAGAWAANPWVWVVEFRKTPNVRVEPPAEGRSAPTRCSASG